jgi:hypothetical protein
MLVLDEVVDGALDVPDGVVVLTGVAAAVVVAFNNTASEPAPVPDGLSVPLTLVSVASTKELDNTL